QLRGVVVMATADGARAAAEYVVQGEYLAADEGLPEARCQRYELPGGAFFEVRDGRIARVSNYYNLEDWLAQVRRDRPGASPPPALRRRVPWQPTRSRPAAGAATLMHWRGARHAESRGGDRASVRARAVRPGGHG